MIKASFLLELCLLFRFFKLNSGGNCMELITYIYICIKEFFSTKITYLVEYFDLMCDPVHHVT